MPFYAASDLANLTKLNQADPSCTGFKWSDFGKAVGADLPADWDLSSYVVNEIYGTPAFTKKAVAVSPINKISKDTPPTLMFHGTKDCVVAYQSSVNYLQKLQQAGVAGELVTVEGEGHATAKFYTTPKYQEKVLAFLKRHL
ncbi:prolyl oligopeptidase family serine peptidase [Neisseria leonii]|uniref:alpha/beta hydrolase family protein n=1 Tax=Neisseria leonii TaxID=2995413 RepID=UPI0030D46B6D